MSNLLYYSTNSLLAFQIAERFYGGQHFVWCSPVFDSSQLDKMDVLSRIPPSSNPCKIFISFGEDVFSNDKHSARIALNKAGLKRGAIIQRDEGIIDDDDLARINYIIDHSSIEDFKPVLYLIPKVLIEERIIRVDVDKTANPLSVEYQIVDLQKHEFEMLHSIKMMYL